MITNIIAKLLTFWIPNKTTKRKIRAKIKNLFYGYDILFKARSIGKNLIVEDYSKVNKKTTIKNNVHINSVYVEGTGELIIGNFCQFGRDVKIITSNHNYDKGGKIPYDESDIQKGVQIADLVWCGSNVTILPGTFIEEGAIIQAGSVVHGKIPKYSIIGGNPAKVFKYRDIEHFKKLKNEEKFLN